MDISISEITLKKVHGNNMDFWTIKITPKKVRGNDVDFSTIEITLKKYVKRRGNSSKFGLRHIDAILA